jgi:hypothetical protein
LHQEKMMEKGQKVEKCKYNNYVVIGEVKHEVVFFLSNISLILDTTSFESSPLDGAETTQIEKVLLTYHLQHKMCTIYNTATLLIATCWS